MTQNQYTPPDSDPEDHQIVVRKRSNLASGKTPIGSQGQRMLSINFSTPLAGAARSERIKQMTNNHPAFAQARIAQEILVKLQTSLRRMPGVSANESNEIISQLQEVGRIISQETSQLVEALMHVTLDSEDTDKAIARMSLEANLAKAQKGDEEQTINDLREELDNEKEKRGHAEGQVRKVMDDLQELTQEFRSWKEKEATPGGSACSDRDDLIKHLEETIKHLEGQVNNRRSLWTVKHPDPRQIAHAIKTITDSCADKEMIQQTIMSLTAGNDENRVPKNLARTFNDMSLQPDRPPTAFQPHRPNSAAPSRYGALQSGPPRAAPSMPRVQSPWNANGPGPGRPPYVGNGTWASPGPGRAPSRRTFHQSGTYRPTAPEFYPSGTQPADRGFQRPDSYGQSGQRRDYYPTTPSMSRGKYGRLQNPVSPDYGMSHSNSMTSRFPVLGPLIHISEMTVAAWHEQIMQLYAVIRLFVENNANEPTDMVPTELRKSRLWSVLMAVYYPLSETEAISYLDFHFKDESSKSCLVTRVIVDYIVNRVWIPQAWCGAEEDISQALVDVERDLEKTQGQPSSFRQPILDRQAVLVDAVLKLDHFPQFSKHKVESITETLMGTILPLLNENSPTNQAFRDMEIIAEAAWGLSSKILSSRLTFDFRFPEVGIRFSCQSMIPIWPNMDPMELQAKHWRIALVTTPVITCRNDTGANISAHSVALADVICMQ